MNFGLGLSQERVHVIRQLNMLFVEETVLWVWISLHHFSLWAFFFC